MKAESDDSIANSYKIHKEKNMFKLCSKSSGKDVQNLQPAGQYLLVC